MSNNRYRSNKITLINDPKLLINNKSFPKFEYEHAGPPTLGLFPSLYCLDIY